MNSLKRPLLVVATRNPGKVHEIEAALAALELQVVGLDPSLPEVVEGGQTFVDNARLKAWAACEAMGCSALADDSGLAVDALGGEPGVHSARWAPTEAERNARLLRELAGVPAAQRTARFVSAIVVCTRDGGEVAVQGTCEGLIGLAPRGTGGFGYDPLFVLPDGRTMAELTTAEKNAVSHRGKALAQVMGALATLLREGAL